MHRGKTKQLIIVYKSVLSVFAQEFSLVVCLHVRLETNPKKIGKTGKNRTNATDALDNSEGR